MPSALASSRRFVAEALARVRSGLDSYDRNLNQPGAEIKVEPFDAQNVSTPAALVKLATSIGAAKRHAANVAAAQKDVELEREKTKAEIAHLRAQAQYELGQGRQGKEAAVLGSDVGPYKKGTLLTDVNADIANRRVASTERGQRAGGIRSSRITAARAGIEDIDRRINRDTLQRAQQAMFTAEPVFKSISQAGDEADPKELLAVGIDPSSWKAQSSFDRTSLIKAARARLLETYAAKHRPSITRYFEPQRRKYQDIIDQAATDQGDGGDPNDPLGLNPLGLDLSGE